MIDGLSVTLSQAGPLAVDAAFVVPPGQTLALVGPSGAGKTSLLKAIAGLVPATGRVQIGGALWLDERGAVPAWQRRAGLVMQGGGLFPHLDALGNVMIAQAQRDAAAAQALLAAVQIGGAALRRQPAELSGGEQMRVALARALARDPAVLLLDEPFAAVDRPVRRALAALVAQVRAASAVPMIIVTHDLEDAARIADTCAFIVAGTIVEQGPAAAVLGDPASQLNQWAGS
ncbi:ATP-binding cassette domain-containing protein [Sandarakinorhabdus sp.]|uniref:ATP-binding cassette domain-containing protein n=1 Tax=Sandarakinorhabdus sp. TaxID=1916663 RepID=UPI00333F0C72